MPGITHNIKRPHENPKSNWDKNLTKVTAKPQTQKLIIHIQDPIKFLG